MEDIASIVCDDPADPWLDRAQLDAEIGGKLHRVTVWRWEREGILPKHHRIGGRCRWRLSEIRAAKAAILRGRDG